MSTLPLAGEVVLAVVVIWKLPDWGRKTVAFLVDFRAYRRESTNPIAVHVWTDHACSVRFMRTITQAEAVAMRRALKEIASFWNPAAADGPGQAAARRARTALEDLDLLYEDAADTPAVVVAADNRQST